jgi:hypothetical protein
MARHPEWFERLDSVREIVRQAEVESLGRREIQAIFGCSERDSIRLLHKFGAEDRANALSLPRTALLAQLDAIAAGSTYAAFLRQRQGVARQLAAARAETAARRFRVSAIPAEDRPRGLADLPSTITLRPGHFAIRYTDGGDLMRQLAEFLSVAGVNREEFFAATETGD